MMTAIDSRSLFISTARTMAVIRHQRTAARRNLGALVTLNPIQLMRDGLAAAADKFARDVEASGMDPSQAEVALAQSLEKAPVTNWWTVITPASPPKTLSPDDIWILPEGLALAD